MRIFFITLFSTFLLLPISNAQTVLIGSENFEGTVFNSTPAGAWTLTNDYSVSGSQSMIGFVPNISGDEIILTSPSYNFSGYSKVLLKFNHICKISPSDITRIEYRIGMNAWRSLDSMVMRSSAVYFGTAKDYPYGGFNAKSYPEWKGADSTAIPGIGWWQEESFDISHLVSFDPDVQFRFILKHGNVIGSQVSYGWLIDDFAVYASKGSTIVPPSITVLSSYPVNTVYRTGPYNLTFRITGDTTIETPVYMKYTYIYDNISMTDSVALQNTGGNLYTGSLPQFNAGTNVKYSVTVRDLSNNYATFLGGYAVRKLTNTMSGYVTIEDNVVQNDRMPIYGSYRYSWSRMLYLADEIDPVNAAGGWITKLAWKCQSNTNVIYDKQTCYFQSTQDVEVPNSFYVNPMGLDNVYSGSVEITQGWVEITLDNPFYLLPGENLLIHWHNKNGQYTSGLQWAASTTLADMGVYSADNNYIPTSGQGTLSRTRPHLRLYFQGGSYGDTSAVISSFISPTQQSVAIGAWNDIEVNLRNTGSADLTTAIINWQVNNGTINTLNWTGNLLWDHEIPVQLGTFFPTADAYDTIRVWVTMPNGIVDSSSWTNALTAIFYGCPANGISGTFTVGENGVFPDLNDAMGVLDRCGASGDVIFSFKSGVYNYGLNFSDFGKIMEPYNLTITSEENNRDSVIFRPRLGYGVKFSKSHNIILEAITVDVQHFTSSSTSGICFLDSCTNITINNSAVYSDSTKSNNSAYPIFKATSNSGVVENIRITNNIICGGYRNMLFSGGLTSSDTLNLGRNIVIEYNLFKNGWDRNVEIYTCDLSFSHNIILSRSYGNVGWTGVYFTITNGDIVGNKIHNFSTLATYAAFSACSLNYHNRYVSSPALVANNEIILHSRSSLTGFYLLGSKLKFYHNSILGGGAATTMNGIVVSSSNENHMYMDARNNNIVLEYSDGTPVLLNSSNYFSRYNFEFNNYGSQRIGSIGGAVFPDLFQWQGYFPQDVNSTSVFPVFNDASRSLELSDYSDVFCHRLSEVTEDINAQNRGVSTAMGCYTSPLFTMDGALAVVLDWDETPSTGASASPKIVLTNGGISTISAAEIGWMFNSTEKTPVMSTKTLNQGESDTILLGNINYVSFHNQLSAYIKSINGSSTIDLNKKNDTITVSAFACNSVLSGNFTIGHSSGDFNSISQAVQALYNCGINGAVTFQVNDGVYVENVKFEGIIPGSDSVNTVTFTSLNNNADLVTVQRTGAASANNAPLMLSNVAHLRFSNLTFDSRPNTDKGSYFHAVLLNPGCRNITIDNCNLIAPKKSASALTSENYAVILNASGGLEDIQIINNLIEGGSAGVYLTGTTTSINKRILIENNTIQMIDQYGVYVNYVDSIRVYDNIISQRNNLASFTGIYYVYYSSGHIIGNKIKVKNLSYGMMLSNILGSYSATTTPVTSVINNEIIADVLLNSWSAAYGIYCQTSAKYNICHNSILITGSRTGTQNAGGICIAVTSANIRATVKNNNITMMTNFADYPMYLSNTTAANWVYYTIDYNNYYSKTGTYTGYAGGARTTLSAWKSIIISDTHSVVQKHYFQNIANSLYPSSVGGLTCPQLTGIGYDINGTARTSTTTMGAYQFSQSAVDILPSNLTINPTSPAAGDTSHMMVTLYNAGSTILTSVNIHWKINGVANATPYLWTGTLGTDSTTQPLFIGDFIPIAGDNEIIVWTSMPNNVMDEDVINDTIKLSKFACGPAMSGTYRIGSGGDFADMASVNAVLQNCGMNGPLTFSFLPGVHDVSVNLGNIVGINATNTLTFTSSTNNAQSTILKAPEGSDIITWANPQYLTVKNLTFDIYDGKTGILLSGTGTDISVTDCIFLLDTVSTATDLYAFYAGTSGTINNLYIARNRIDGGYKAIYVYINGINRIYEDNVITNVSGNGFELRNGTTNRLSNNTITSRKENNTGRWYGIFATGAYSEISGNIIRTLSKSITEAHGINLQSLNNMLPMLISNNDISIHAVNNGYGLYLGYSLANVINNSICVEGGGGNQISALDVKTISSFINITNNILVSKGSAYAITSNTGIGLINSDYNNYYSQTSISTNYPTFAAWQQFKQTDIHSINIYPTFIDPSISLEYIPSPAFYTPVSSYVTKDINGNIRTKPSLMGAYNFASPNLDVELSAIIGIPDYGIVQGQALTPLLIIRNTGLSTIDSVRIYYERNGVSQTINWAGHLESNKSDTLTLETISSIATGSYSICAYLQKVNNSSLDMNQQNDTLCSNFVVCNALYNGTYTVGTQSATFPTISDAINTLKTCGFSGNVVLSLQNGTYLENVDLTDLNSLMGSYRLEITSAGKTAADVIIRSPDNQTTVTIKKSHNITLDALTIEALTSGSHGIDIIDSCWNITISNCSVISDTLSTETNNSYGIYRTGVLSLTDYLNNILVEKNIIRGGRAGINLNENAGTARNINIKNNLIYDQYESGIVLNVLNSTSSNSSEISFNTILSRASEATASNTWNGMNLIGYISINGNKIHERNTDRKNMRGIYSATNTQLITNNEIIGSATEEAMGIFCENAGLNINILHNSIFLAGNTLQLGIHAVENGGGTIKIAGNNIVLASEEGYPIGLLESPWSTIIRNINLNNYHAPSFVGRRSTDIYNTPPVYASYPDMTSWRSIIASDVASVNITPNFIDVSQSLELTNYTGLYCNRDADVLRDIKDSVRTGTTTIGAYGISIGQSSAVFDLELTQIVNPFNNSSSSDCAPDFVSVQYAISNVGTGVYDFSQDTLLLHLSIRGMKGDLDTVISISSGSLSLGSVSTFTLINFLDVSFAGDYHITAWINSVKDSNYLNDTLRMTYKTNKIALPYEEDFSTSNMPSLVVENIAGTNGWHVEQGGNNVIAPNFGTGMLVMDGSYGTVSSLKIGQIELERIVSPMLEFWYEHDNKESSKRDQIVVKVLWNGGENTAIIYKEIKRYDASYTTAGWKNYIVDLSPYVDSSCVVVSLEAYSYGGIQFIDRINITSSQDMAVQKMILTPEIDICDLGRRRDIQLVISNETAQRINFAETPADLHISLSGNGIYRDTIWQLSGSMEDGQIDTLDVFTDIDFRKGTYDFIAYIRTSLADANKWNDTIKETIAITPDFEIDIQTISTMQLPAAVGLERNQLITITNTGNMELQGINLILSVDTATGKTYFETMMTIPGSLSPGETKTFTFDSAYIVPQKSSYEVIVRGYLICDSALANTISSEQEYADLNDLAMIKIVRPEDNGTTMDVVGDQMEVSIEIENLNPGQLYGPGDVTVGIMITDLNGKREGNLISEEINKSVAAGSPVSYTFNTKYTVPKLGEYYLVVYIEKRDQYQQNDTLKMLRRTPVSVSNLKGFSFTMEQNIPNPAKDKTVINYNIPQDGEVTFRVYSVSGQLLYNQKENVLQGDNRIELNISDYASGIYFYTMEYKGQRIVKKMSIRR